MFATMFRRTIGFTAGNVLGLSRQFAVTGRHSKNVQGKKNKLDLLRSKRNDKIAKKIIMTVKAGGNDVQSNPALARVLKEAQAAKLPKDNIERALNRGNDSNSVSYTTTQYEVFGHGGAGIIVQTVSDNANRTNSDVKAIVKKAEAKMAGIGSVLFSFDEKAMFTPTDPFNSERVMVAALEADLDDIDFTPNPENTDEVELPDLVITEPEALGTLQDMMDALGISGTASLVYIPQDKVKLSPEDYEKNMAMIETLEEHDDVDAIFHNMENQ